MNRFVIVLVAFLAFVSAYALFVEPNALEINHYKIQDKQLSGIKIAFISDLNLGKTDFKKLDNVIKKINKEKPDITLIGGDFVNGSSPSRTMNLDIMAQKLSLLHSKVFTVLGSEDYTNDYTKIISALRKNDIYVLQNDRKKIIVKRRYVDIVGIDDFTSKRANIQRAFYRSITPRIVLTHNPDIYYQIMEESNIILAGHNHGGQIILPLMPPLFMNSKFGSKFASGLIKETQNQMIITKGIGTRIVPMRLNCKPEIVIIDFI